MKTDPLVEIEFHTGAIPQLQSRRHLLFCQGDEWDFIYIVKDGWVLLYEVLEDGRKQILKFAGPGSILGFMPSGSRYMTHTGECLTTVVLSAIPRLRFDRALRDRPGLAMWLAGNAARDLEATFHRLTIVGRCSARERLAHLVVELACLNQPDIRDIERDGAILLPPVTRQQIGDALGLTCEHISRVFREFKDEGLIEAQCNRIKVIDLQGLADIAGIDLDIISPYKRVPTGMSSQTSSSAFH